MMKNPQISIMFFVAVLLAFSGCEIKEKVHSPESVITPAGLIRHISVLASDEFEGRGIGGNGEKKTLDYLTKEFSALGLKPGAGNSFLQEFELLRYNTKQLSNLAIKAGGKNISFKYGSDYVASGRVVGEKISVENKKIVFAGFGINAPKYARNDYAGVDVRDKIVVVFVNDPGLYSEDSSYFKGKELTMYGRWDYKFEEAARRGAAGILIVHEDYAASYPWSVVENSFGGTEYFQKSSAGLGIKFAGWISGAKAKELFSAAGLNLEKERERAAKKEFKAVELNATGNIALAVTSESIKTNNFIAKIEGTDLKHEAVFYTAHWDHLGYDSTLSGDDKIYNGALDNASGVSALIEIAKSLMQMPELKKPRRSIYFLITSAEEKGLLGAEYYVRHPVVSLSKTIANINVDGINIFGKTADIVLVSSGHSDLDLLVYAAAKQSQKSVSPNPHPESGGMFRSDQYSFAKSGVPVIYFTSGILDRESGGNLILQKKNEWIKNFYHTPKDEYDQNTWDMDAAVEDVKLLFTVGMVLVREKTYPKWNEDSEFRK